MKFSLFRRLPIPGVLLAPSTALTSRCEVVGPFHWRLALSRHQNFLGRYKTGQLYLSNMRRV